MDPLFRWGNYSANATTPNLPPVQIPPEEYFTRYQTVLVLGGIGAAFRTARHLAAQQAVVLQDFPYQEWFVHLLTPYQHYVPLARDLSDLQDQMEWVRDHPQQVQQIAQRGQAFYWQYLSFQKTSQHWYELLWRLSLLIHEKGPTPEESRSGRDVWPDSTFVTIFQRNASTGLYEPVDKEPFLQ